MTLAELTNIHTVTIQERTQSQDSTGAMYHTWSTVDGAPTKARVVPMNVREILDYQRSGVEASHKIIFSEDPSMTPNKRIVYDNQVYLFGGELNWHNLNRGWTVMARLLTSHPDNV